MKIERERERERDTHTHTHQLRLLCGCMDKTVVIIAASIAHQPMDTVFGLFVFYEWILLLLSLLSTTQRFPPCMMYVIGCR